MGKTYSICVRVQRTRVEYAYVSVPLNDAVLVSNEVGEVIRDEKGSGSVDGDKVFGEAIRLASEGSGRWYEEETRLEVHPIQKAPETDEERLNWPEGFKPFGV